MSPAHTPKSAIERLIEKALGAIADVKGDVGSLRDDITRQAARQDEAIARLSKVEARLETVGEELQRAKLSREELLATVTESYRRTDRQLRENRERTILSGQELGQALEASSEPMAEAAAVKVEAKARPVRKWLLGGSLVGAGGGLVVILDNLPKAAKALHALWVAGAAGGADLIK